MTRHIIFRDLFDPDPAHSADRIREIFLYERFLKPDRLEDLRPLIRLDGGDPHLRRDLHDTMQDRVIVIRHCGIIILLQHITFDQKLDGLMGKIRIDRTRSISQQRGKMMYLPWLSGLQDDRHRSTLLRPYQVLLKPRQRQKGRHGDMVFIYPSVRQDQDIRAFPDGAVHLDEQIIHSFLKP